MNITFEELELLMQPNGVEEKPAKEPANAHGDFLDYMKQLNTTSYVDDAHADINGLKPINSHDMSRAEAPEFDLDQHYSQVHDMDMSLGQGGQLPNSFDVGVRPQYEFDV